MNAVLLHAVRETKIDFLLIINTTNKLLTYIVKRTTRAVTKGRKGASTLNTTQ